MHSRFHGGHMGSVPGYTGFTAACARCHCRRIGPLPPSPVAMVFSTHPHGGSSPRRHPFRPVGKRLGLSQKRQKARWGRLHGALLPRADPAKGIERIPRVHEAWGAWPTQSGCRPTPIPARNVVAGVGKRPHTRRGGAGQLFWPQASPPPGGREGIFNTPPLATSSEHDQTLKG